MMWSALILGLGGSPHCAGMCGPIALALPTGALTGRHFLAGRLLYNTGRVLTYVILGALFGLFGQSLAWAGLQQGLSIAAGAFMMLSAVLLWTGARPGRSAAWMARFLAPLKRQLGRRLGGSSLGGLFVIGLLNGLLPCGLVVFALAGAAATGDALNGAVYMALFGLGTTPMMLALSLTGSLLQTGARRIFQRIAPAMLLILGALFLLRGLELGIPYLSPDLKARAHMQAPAATTNAPPAKPHCCCCEEE